VRDDEPIVLVVDDQHDGASHIGASGSHYQGQKDPRKDALPSGSFAPERHHTLDAALRDWVEHQTSVDLGYVEQLYTFADRGRGRSTGSADPHVVSVSYLALTRTSPTNGSTANPQGARWCSWYDYFPWEDWRRGKPVGLLHDIEARLRLWCDREPLTDSKPNMPDRRARCLMAFGFENGSWDEERVLERYELLYEAGLVAEAKTDGCEAADSWETPMLFGRAMHHDHRRILATAISRMRGKIKYRPVVFELMPPEFTLFELQKTVEAILGPHLHKQNFRRLVEGAGLVQPTSEVRAKTGGRPAKLFRFRHEVFLERPAPGVRVKPSRS
ncbi:MAG: NAD regulator, partial [Pseudomonadota bacterium]